MDFYATDLHYLSPTEFQSGLPTCDPRVFPVRCPDGTCAVPGLAEFDTMVPCNCVGNYTLLTCDCGCSCSASNCTCPAYNSVFEANLLGQLQGLSTCSCHFDPTPATAVSTPGMYNGSYWVAPASGILLDIEIPSCVSPLLYGDGTPLSISVTCINNVTVVIPEYTVWDNVTSFSVASPNQPTFYWSPGGIPVWRAANVSVTASSNGSAAGSVLSMDREFWSPSRPGPSCLELGFGRFFRLLGLQVSCIFAQQN